MQAGGWAGNGCWARFELGGAGQGLPFEASDSSPVKEPRDRTT